ncbi:MAG: D-alanyl-D-alanine carboxypeptidase, partial [Treponema sp.]|nr:D-alanyl-D-alanine carboxypeptidase [Treponema sp.]
TLRELLEGLSVTSGNDAAIAVAACVSGGTEQFIRRMNEECLKLGLTNTHFVEPSGYSEKNTTTARELAGFCRAYIDIFPEGLKLFHSLPSFSYPKKENLPDWPEYKNTQSWTKKNTNTLLGKLEGCDGIKTGYIDESGYNIALTCMRDGQRFISVTLGGPGNSTAEGNRTREHDGELLMEWAFESFADYIPSEHVPSEFAIAVPGSSDGKYAYLVPAWNEAVSVPHVLQGTARECAEKVTAGINYPEYVFGGVNAGTEYGSIEYKLGDALLERVPLVADRTMKQSGIFGRILDRLACLLF